MANQTSKRSKKISTDETDDFQMGVALFKKKNYDQSIVHLKIAEEVEPGEMRNHFWLGSAYFGKEEYDQSINHFEKAVELEPNATNHYWLARAFFGKRDFDQCLAHLGESAKLEPDAGIDYNYFSLGMAYYGDGDHNRIIARLEKTIKLKPSQNLLKLWLDHTRKLKDGEEIFNLKDFWLGLSKTCREYANFHDNSRKKIKWTRTPDETLYDFAIGLTMAADMIVDMNFYIKGEKPPLDSYNRLSNAIFAALKSETSALCGEDVLGYD